MTEPISAGYRAEELFEVQVTITHGLEGGYVGIFLEITGKATKPTGEGVPVTVQDGTEPISQEFSNGRELLIIVQRLVRAEGTFRESGEIRVVDEAIGHVKRMIAMNPGEGYLILLRHVMSRLLDVRQRSTSEAKSLFGQDEVVDLVSKGDVEAVEALFNSFCAWRDIVYLRSAIRIVERLIAAHPSNDFLRGIHSDMSRLLVESDIEPSIESSGLSDADAPLDALRWRMEFAIIWIFEYFVSGDDAYLDKAIGQVQRCIAANHPSEIVLYSLLSELMSFMADRTPLERSRVPIAGAVPRANATRPIPMFMQVDEIVELMLEDTKAEITEAFGNLSFSQSNGFDDVDYAITVKHIMAAIYPLDHANRPRTLYRLSFLLARWFEKLGDLNDLERAIEAAEGELVPTTFLDPSCLGDLGLVFLMRFTRLGGMDDLEKATRLCQEALGTTPLGDPRRISNLGNLIRCFSSRFHRMGSLEDLEKAIQGIEEALDTTQTGHKFRVAILQLAGVLYTIRYQQLRSVIDLDKAIHITEEALTMATLNNSFRAMTLSNLASLMRLRFTLTGDMRDLEMGITMIKEAMENTPIQHLTRVALLNNLSVLLCMRFTRLGEMHDLELGFQAVQNALAMPSGGPEHGMLLCNLSTLFHWRYIRLNALDDIEKAVQLIEEAVATTPYGHPDRFRMLSNAIALFKARFSRSNSLDDIQNGIRLSREAAAELPSNRNAVTLDLNTGALFSVIFHRSRDVDDLEKALQALDRAFSAIPTGHQERAGHLRCLRDVYRRKFTLSRDMSDLEKAIQASAEVVATTPADHFDRAVGLTEHARLLYSRFLVTATFTEILGAFLAWHSAWECTGSPLDFRIGGAICAAQLLCSFKRWKQASSLLEDVIKLLPILSPRILGRDDQQYVLSQVKSLTADAVSTALYAGSTALHCIGLLELSRGIIMGLSIDCRSDFSELRARHGKIFNRYNHLRIQIDRPLLKIEGESYLSCENHRRHRLQITHKMNEIINDIRGLPGFERFLLPPSSKSLIAVAAEGPIVIFNATEFRSDAIIITGAGIKSIRLGKMTYADVKQHMESLPGLARGKQSTYTSRNEKLEQFLLWLWDVAVEPVFDELMFGAVKDANLPRIWWIGVGVLAMAPFHAAGDHSRRSTRNTFCRAISSYTLTLKALSYAPLPLKNHAGRWKPLTNALKEVEEIADIAMNHSKTTILNSPTATQVLKELPAFHAIHFACHGVSDSKNPSSSHLLLHRTNGPEKLTVGAISKRNIRNAQLAYLSACSTADNASADLADESIHIASGFQLAGFTHVLGTMWESNDAACRQVAVDFYSELFNDKARHKGHRAVSTAFNRAVKKLRKGALRQPIIWASFIHTGA
ncbi:hypothetical protein Q9L58_009459 [Maublancomyces gigas]|uniref:CHAT domain-containing protein n=1 Tax=Discina gigas TaxID=1032678 RepID=A0ABR3G6V9_9PEZI